MFGGFNEYRDVMSGGVTNLCKNGTCSQCGGCCGAVLPISDKEIREILRYIRVHNIKPVQHVVIPMVDTIDLICPFCDTAKEKEKCRIYEVRPLICKLFQCNDPHGALRHPELYEDRREAVNMWERFFGKARYEKNRIDVSKLRQG